MKKKLKMKKQLKAALLAPFRFINHVTALPFAFLFGYANAQTGGNWYDSINTASGQFGNGLKNIAAGIAICCLIWCGIQIMYGGKRLQDVAPWAIGGILVGSARWIVPLILP